MKSKKIKRTLPVLLSAALLFSSFNTAAAPLGTEEAVEPAALVNDGLLIDFDMDSLEGNSILNKADGKAYAVLGDNPALTDGKDGHGKALLMDGRTNYVNLGKDYQVTENALTIAAWVKPDSAHSGMMRIFGRGRTAVTGEKELSLYMRQNGALEAQCPEWSASDPGTVTMDEWQHVAVTNDGTTQRLYLNGAVVKEETCAGPTEEWDLDLLLGSCWNTDASAVFSDHLFQGGMDDVKLYSRALSEEEIQTLADIDNGGGGGEGGGEDIELPDALYEFTMDEVKDGTGELEGQKVIVNHADQKEYPIYGNYRVDDFGIYDKSIEFDGATTYVDIGRPPIHTQYTFEAWTNIDNSSANSLNKIFGRDKTTVPRDAFYFCVRNNGNIEAEIRDDVNNGWMEAGAGSYEFNNWNHLALTCDGTVYSLYYNGELIAQETFAEMDLDTNPLSMLIGCGYNKDGTGLFNGHAFKGRMDDVRIYDKALTAEQIKKSTEGIKDSIPPEVVSISPAEGSLLSVEGKLSIEYNMSIALGSEKPQILDKDQKPVPAEAVAEDHNESVEGTETLVVYPTEKLKSGMNYTYHIPAGAAVNAQGTVNQEKEWTFSVSTDLAGDSENSDLNYWASGDVDVPSSIEKKEGKLILSNGLVERVFDIGKNFQTISYKNLYTGLELLNTEDLQADASITLNKEYADNSTQGDQLFYIGGENQDVSSFQFVDYEIEEKTEEPFHWEWDERISPESMKDTQWPAAGKALVVNYKAPKGIDKDFADVKVQVRYEIYDGIPSISKSVHVTNEGKNDVIVDKMEVEILPVPVTLKDALYVEGTMNSGNENHDRNNGKERYKQWEDVDGTNGKIISRYAAPAGDNTIAAGMGYDTGNIGPNYRLAKDETFDSYKVYQMFYSNSYYEWQMMEVKKMYRVLFPQTADAPLIYHIISSDDATVKKGIDQAHNAGFNMVLLSFGSGVNVEDTSASNIAKYKALCDYAHEKGMLLGAYVMQAARGGSESFSGCWGTMRCMCGTDAHETLESTLEFIDQTGLDCLEVDGIYPGAICTATNHSGHEGVEDSQTKQWEYAVHDFYRELRARNVYINSPDWNFTVGASMAVMGYQEPGFNVTPWRQLIYGREMAYYGTFEKVPAMGWTLVPLSPYQGGSDSSFWPYDEKIMAYDFMIGMNMMYGITGSYRGGNGLYQGEVSQNVIETWGEFYNKYKDILGESVVHIAPPLATSDTSLTTDAIDGIIHVDSDGVQKGLAAFFNQTTETVTQTVKIPLYYTGLTGLASPPAPVEGSHYRASGVFAELVKMPEVPEIPEVNAVPTENEAYVCIGDMNGKKYTIDSNGNIEVELTLEPNTYTWLTVYDPENIPEDAAKTVEIPAPDHASVKEAASDHASLTWDPVQMEGRNVKEYHIYRNGEYLDKTFTNEYVDTTLAAEQEYEYSIMAVHNSVAGKGAAVRVSTMADETAPQAVSAKAVSKNQIQVTFNEFTEKETTENIQNYTVENGSVIKAEQGTDGKSVVLTIEGTLEAFKEINISVNHVKDLVGNEMTEENVLKVVFGYLGEYKFEEEEGNTAQNSKGGIEGTIQGAVARTEGIEGQGLLLDGATSYLDLGDILKGNGEYTLNGWINVENTDGSQVIVGRERDSYDSWKWKLYIEDGQLKFSMNNGKGAYPGHEADGEIVMLLESGQSVVEAGKWQQFALSQNGDTVTLYLNGEAVAEQTQEGISNALTPYTTWFGAMRNNAGGEPVQNLKGILDEVTVYNTVLNGDQVKEQYNLHAQPVDPDPDKPNPDDPDPDKPDPDQPNPDKPDPDQPDPDKPDPDKPNPDQPGFDTSILSDLIEKAKAIKSDGYTQESYNALQDAIKAAEDALGKVKTDDELNQAVAELQKAVDGLVKEGTDPGKEPGDKPNQGGSNSNKPSGGSGNSGGTSAKTVKTGDESGNMIALWGILLACAGAGIVIVVRKKYKRQ